MSKKVMCFAIAMSLTACASPSRFEWGNYENSLYAYSKTPEAREAYRKSLADAIERGESSDRLAPGLHAELGYLFLEDNNNADAVASFQKEMAAFPESREFLQALVARLNGSAAQPAPVAVQASPAS